MAQQSGLKVLGNRSPLEIYNPQDGIRQFLELGTSKSGAPSDPISKEKGLRSFQLPDHLAQKEKLQLLKQPWQPVYRVKDSTWGRSFYQTPAAIPTAHLQAGYAPLLAQEDLRQKQEDANQRYVADYWQWMRGREGAAQIPNKTDRDRVADLIARSPIYAGGHQEGLMCLPGAADHIDGYIDARAAFERKVTELAVRGPRNQDESWYYFKYVVNGIMAPPDEQLKFLQTSEPEGAPTTPGAASSSTYLNAPSDEDEEGEATGEGEEAERSRQDREREERDRRLEARNRAKEERERERQADQERRTRERTEDVERQGRERTEDTARRDRERQEDVAAANARHQELAVLVQQQLQRQQTERTAIPSGLEPSATAKPLTTAEAAFPLYIRDEIIDFMADQLESFQGALFARSFTQPTPVPSSAPILPPPGPSEQQPPPGGGAAAAIQANVDELTRIEEGLVAQRANNAKIAEVDRRMGAMEEWTKDVTAIMADLQEAVVTADPRMKKILQDHQTAVIAAVDAQKSSMTGQLIGSIQSLQKSQDLLERVFANMPPRSVPAVVESASRTINPTAPIDAPLIAKQVMKEYTGKLKQVQAAVAKSAEDIRRDAADMRAMKDNFALQLQTMHQLEQARTMGRLEATVGQPAPAPAPIIVSSEPSWVAPLIGKLTGMADTMQKNIGHAALAVAREPQGSYNPHSLADDVIKEHKRVTDDLRRQKAELEHQLQAAFDAARDMTPDVKARNTISELNRQLSKMATAKNQLADEADSYQQQIAELTAKMAQKPHKPAHIKASLEQGRAKLDEFIEKLHSSESELSALKKTHREMEEDLSTQLEAEQARSRRLEGIAAGATEGNRPDVAAILEELRKSKADLKDAKGRVEEGIGKTRQIIALEGVVKDQKAELERLRALQRHEQEEVIKIATQETADREREQREHAQAIARKEAEIAELHRLLTETQEAIGRREGQVIQHEGEQARFIRLQDQLRAALEANGTIEADRRRLAAELDARIAMVEVAEKEKTAFQRTIDSLRIRPPPVTPQLQVAPEASTSGPVPSTVAAPSAPPVLPQIEVTAAPSPLLGLFKIDDVHSVPNDKLTAVERQTMEGHLHRWGGETKKEAMKWLRTNPRVTRLLLKGAGAIQDPTLSDNVYRGQWQMAINYLRDRLSLAAPAPTETPVETPVETQVEAPAEIPTEVPPPVAETSTPTPALTSGEAFVAREIADQLASADKKGTPKRLLAEMEETTRSPKRHRGKAGPSEPTLAQVPTPKAAKEAAIKEIVVREPEGYFGGLSEEQRELIARIKAGSKLSRSEVSRLYAHMKQIGLFPA